MRSSPSGLHRPVHRRCLPIDRYVDDTGGTQRTHASERYLQQT